MSFDEATVNADARDDRVGAKNTELDSLTVREEELLVRGYEFPYGLIHQEHDGGICAPPPKEQKPASPHVEDLLHYIVFFGPS